MESEAVLDRVQDNETTISNRNAFMLTAIESFHHPSYRTGRGLPITANQLHLRCDGYLDEYGWT